MAWCEEVGRSINAFFFGGKRRGNLLHRLQKYTSWQNWEVYFYSLSSSVGGTGLTSVVRFTPMPLFLSDLSGFVVFESVGGCRNLIVRRVGWAASSGAKDVCLPGVMVSRADLVRWVIIDSPLDQLGKERAMVARRLNKLTSDQRWTSISESSQNTNYTTRTEKAE